MTNEEYIASGILELYAAGGLSESEKEEVARMASTHPEIKIALEEIQQAVEAYAKLHAVTPPPGLKAKILSGITAQQHTAVPEPRVIPFKPAEAPQKTSGFNWAIAAAITLLAVSSALNFYFYKNWKNAETDLSIALSGQEKWVNSYRTVQQRLSQTEVALQVMKDEKTATVALKGLPKAPEASAKVFWNPGSETVLISLKNLPAPPAGSQYQLWALHNGKPIDAGMITLENGVSFQEMKRIGEAEAFAVTLEPAGGSVNPTLDQMYLMGKI